MYLLYIYIYIYIYIYCINLTGLLVQHCKLSFFCHITFYLCTDILKSNESLYLSGSSETEASHFSEAMKNPSFKTNPLAAIGDHLRKRLKQEDEQI